MNINTQEILNIRFIPILFLLLTVGCGGSSSGGGSVGVVNDTAVLNNTACAADMDELMNAGELNGRLENLSAGCDYLVARTISFNSDITIEPGVTFLLEAGVSMNFGSNEVTFSGTAQSPIQFVAEQAGKNWGSIEVRADKVNIEHTRFSNGGSDSEAALLLNGSQSEISLSDTVVSGSQSNGLLLGSYGSTVLLFENNVFQGNSGYGLVLNSFETARELDKASDYLGAQSANAEVGVEVLGTSSSSGAVIPDIGVPYRLRSPDRAGRLYMSTSLIEAGVVIEFPENMSLTISRSTLNGTASSPITLTSFHGDTSTIWGGVDFASNSVMRHTVIENAGGGESAGAAALIADDGVLENVEILNPESWGVTCSNSDSDPLSVTNIEVSGAGAGNIHPNCSIDLATVSFPDVDSVDTSQCVETYIADVQSIAQYTFENYDAECDYFIAGDVDLSNALLKPGVTLVFARDASMEVGTLTALGTAAMPITLKAERAQDGYWDGVTLGNEGSQLSYVSIEDGGAADGQGLAALDGVFDSRFAGSVSMNNVSVTGSLGNGMVVHGSEILEFSNNQFIGNGGNGLIIPYDQLDILDTASLFDSPMAPNGDKGIYLISNNSFAAISYPVILEMDLTLRNLGSSYRLASMRVDDVDLTVNAGVQLLFEEGGYLTIDDDSTLELLGTDEQPIELNAFSGEQTGWGGVSLGNAFISASNVNIISAGAAESGAFRGVEQAALSFLSSGSIVNLTNVDISESSGWAINCNTQTNPSNFNFSGLTYSNNNLGDINPECGS